MFEGVLSVNRVKQFKFKDNYIFLIEWHGVPTFNLHYNDQPYIIHIKQRLHAIVLPEGSLPGKHIDSHLLLERVTSVWL